MKTILTGRLVENKNGIEHYEFGLCEEKIITIYKVGSTYNYPQEIPEFLMDMLEAWIEERL